MTRLAGCGVGKLAEDNPSVFFLRKNPASFTQEAFLGHGLELHTCKLKILIDKLCLWVYNYFDEGLGKFIRTMPAEMMAWLGVFPLDLILLMELLG